MSDAEVFELREIFAAALSADPELIESLEIVTGTLEAIAADRKAEADWEDAQEYAGNRCPERE